jgi:hypothetical protein
MPFHIVPCHKSNSGKCDRLGQLSVFPWTIPFLLVATGVQDDVEVRSPRGGCPYGVGQAARSVGGW